MLAGRVGSRVAWDARRAGSARFATAESQRDTETSLAAFEGGHRIRSRPTTLNNPGSGTVAAPRIFTAGTCRSGRRFM